MNGSLFVVKPDQAFPHISHCFIDLQQEIVLMKPFGWNLSEQKCVSSSSGDKYEWLLRFQVDIFALMLFS